METPAAPVSARRPPVSRAPAASARSSASGGRAVVVAPGAPSGRADVEAIEQADTTSVLTPDFQASLRALAEGRSPAPRPWERTQPLGSSMSALLVGREPSGAVEPPPARSARSGTNTAQFPPRTPREPAALAIGSPQLLDKGPPTLVGTPLLPPSARAREASAHEPSRPLLDSSRQVLEQTASRVAQQELAFRAWSTPDAAAVALPAAPEGLTYQVYTPQDLRFPRPPSASLEAIHASVFARSPSWRTRLGLVLLGVCLVLGTAAAVLVASAEEPAASRRTPDRSGAVLPPRAELAAPVSVSPAPPGSELSAPVSESSPRAANPAPVSARAPAPAPPSSPPGKAEKAEKSDKTEKAEKSEPLTRAAAVGAAKPPRAVTGRESAKPVRELAPPPNPYGR